MKKAICGGNYEKHKPTDRLLRAGLRKVRRPDRDCVRERGLDTCADCAQMDGCPMLGRIAVNSPFVLEDLKRLCLHGEAE